MAYALGGLFPSPLSPAALWIPSLAVLAQEIDILLLDEPTTYLDLAHQLEVLDLLAKLNAEGKTIIMVLHDLDHAASYAHHLVALADGRVFAEGAPEQVITESIIRAVFNVDSLVIPHPVTGLPLCLPLRKEHLASPEDHQV